MSDVQDIQKINRDDIELSLRKDIEEILSNVNLLTLATINSHNMPHVNTCYFTHDESLNLYILTPPSSRHAIYAMRDGVAAVNIADTNHRVGDPIAGLQLSCHFSMAEGDAGELAFQLYCKRHPKITKYIHSYDLLLENLESRFFILKISDGQIIHETRLGSENYIRFEVSQ